MKSIGAIIKHQRYLLFDKSGGYISIGDSIEEAVLVIVGLDRIVFTLHGGKNTGLGAKQTTFVTTIVLRTVGNYSGFVNTI